MASRTKLCFHMLAHCPSHLTVANRNNSWFSVALLQRQMKHSINILFYHNNLDFFLNSNLKGGRKKKPYVMVKWRQHLSFPGLSTTGWTSVKWFLVKTNLPQLQHWAYVKVRLATGVYASYHNGPSLNRNTILKSDISWNCIIGCLIHKLVHSR